MLNASCRKLPIDIVEVLRESLELQQGRYSWSPAPRLVFFQHQKKMFISCSCSIQSCLDLPDQWLKAVNHLREASTRDLLLVDSRPATPLKHVTMKWPGSFCSTYLVKLASLPCIFTSADNPLSFSLLEAEERPHLTCPTNLLNL